MEGHAPVIPVLGAETGDSWGLLTILTESASSMVNERLSLKQESEERLREIPNVDFWPCYVYTYVCMHTYT